MEKQVTAKEIRKDMEHLVKLLHREWERSGRTKAVVTISLSDTAEISQGMAVVIMEKQKLLETDGLAFRESMALSRNNFVLLRLLKKMKKAEEKTVRKGLDMEFAVELDTEEYRLFVETAGTREG